jgi:hypothetical protein
MGWIVWLIVPVLMRATGGWGRGRPSGFGGACGSRRNWDRQTVQHDDNPNAGTPSYPHRGW